MRFITFQSKEVADMLRKGNSFKLNVEQVGRNIAMQTYLYRKYIGLVEDVVGFNPIYVIPAEDDRDMLVRSIYCNKSKPESIIVFESTEYRTLNYVELVRGMSALKVGRAFRGNIEATELDRNFIKDYIVPEIESFKVIDIIDIVDEDSDIDFNTKCIRFINSGDFEKALSSSIKINHSVANYLERFRESGLGMDLLRAVSECSIGDARTEISKDKLKRLYELIDKKAIIDK